MIGVVGLIMSGQRDHGGMMKIIVPNRIHSIAAALNGSDQSRVLRFILRRYDGRAAARSSTHPMGDLGENVNLGSVVNILCSVQTKSVQVEFVNPVPRVGNEEFAHRAGIGPVEVERFTPFGGVAVGKIIGRKVFEEIALRSGVIVNHVQDDAEAGAVSVIDEGAKIIRSTVKPCRGKKIDAVVSPSIAAIKVVNLHDLQDGHTELL